MEMAEWGKNNIDETISTQAKRIDEQADEGPSQIEIKDYLIN